MVCVNCIFIEISCPEILDVSIFYKILEIYKYIIPRLTAVE